MLKNMIGAMGGGGGGKDKLAASAADVRPMSGPLGEKLAGMVGRMHEKPKPSGGGAAAQIAQRTVARGKSGGTSTLGALAGGGLSRGLSAFTGGFLGRKKKKPGAGNGGAGGNSTVGYGTLGSMSRVMKRGGS